MKNLIRDNKSEIPKTHELQIILSPFVNEVTKDTIWVTLDGAAKIGYYAGSDRPENTVRLEAGADNESFKSCFVDSGNCFDKKNPEPFYIDQNGKKVLMDGYFVVYGHGGFVFKDEQIIILADLPGTQDKTCIIMTKIQFEKMFLINPFNPTQMQTIKLMNWARKTHTEKFGIAVNEILETNYSSNKLKN